MTCAVTSDLAGKEYPLRSAWPHHERRLVCRLDVALRERDPCCVSGDRAEIEFRVSVSQHGF